MIEAELFTYTNALLLLAALGAGFIDSVAGGGGLIQVPALFAAYPQQSPANLLGTNKVASIGGTLFAAKKYLSVVKLPYLLVIPAIVSSFLGSFLGAWLVRGIPLETFRMLLPLILFGLLLYTMTKSTMGLAHAPVHATGAKRWASGLMGFGIGLYDGFFGPGTGSFLMIGFIRIFGFDFLHASAATKLVNATTNLAAIILFATFDQINWALGFSMMLMNIIGGILGSTYALRHGNSFVRYIFILVVGLLIAKTSWDALKYI